MRSDTSNKPVLIASLGVFLFSILDAMMKVIASAYPLGQSTGMRYFAGAIAATIFYLVVARTWPKRNAILRSFPRSIANLLAGTCFFVAIARLPLVDAVVLTFLSPLFLALFGRVILGERLKRITLAAIMIGLLGVFLIVRGQSEDTYNGFDPIGFGAAIATAALYALSMVMTRNHSSKDSLPTLVLLPSVIGAIIAAPTMVLTWEPVPDWHYVLLACIGVLGTAGYVCLAWAYSNSHVSRLGLLDYTGLIWAAVIGYFIFSETPSLWTFGGAILIIGSCIPSFYQKAHV